MSPPLGCFHFWLRLFQFTNQGIFDCRGKSRSWRGTELYIAQPLAAEPFEVVPAFQNPNRISTHRGRTSTIALPASREPYNSLVSSLAFGRVDRNIKSQCSKNTSPWMRELWRFL